MNQIIVRQPTCLVDPTDVLPVADVVSDVKRGKNLTIGVSNLGPLGLSWIDKVPGECGRKVRSGCRDFVER